MKNTEKTLINPTQDELSEMINNMLANERETLKNSKNIIVQSLCHNVEFANKLITLEQVQDKEVFIAWNTLTYNLLEDAYNVINNIEHGEDIDAAKNALYSHITALFKALGDIDGQGRLMASEKIYLRFLTFASKVKTQYSVEIKTLMQEKRKIKKDLDSFKTNGKKKNMKSTSKKYDDLKNDIKELKVKSMHAYKVVENTSEKVFRLNIENFLARLILNKESFTKIFNERKNKNN